MGTSFSQNYGTGTNTGAPQNVFRFPNPVWASTSGAFRIVSNTLVLDTVGHFILLD